jgi:integrase
MFVRAITHGWLRREGNPTTFLPKWRERSRERVLDPEELAVLWRVAPQVNETFGRILRLLILTGCRKSEVAGLMWREVDLDRALLTISGARTKNRRALTVPLAPAAVAILEGVPRFSDVLVFPSFGWGHTKKRLDELAGIGPWVIHDIRRSCRSLWIEEEHGLGLDVHLCELMLGHALPGIIGVYDRATRLPERRRALERWADLVLRAAGEPVEGATVVRIRS